jgi:hypothetical protein
MRTILLDSSQLRTQRLYVCKAACRLGLEIMEVGKCGEEGHRATGDLVYEVLLKRVGMVQEFFDKGERVHQGGGIVRGHRGYQTGAGGRGRGEGTSAMALNVRGLPRSKSGLKNICGMEESGGSNLGGRRVRRVSGGLSSSGSSSCIDAA